MLTTIWLDLVREYFPHLIDLNDYKLLWSTRKQKRVLASCNVYKKRVIVAQIFQNPKYSLLLDPLLYHEMCHAALGPPQTMNGRRIIHGKDFYELEKRHPRIELLNKWIKDGGWHVAIRKRPVRNRLY